MSTWIKITNEEDVELSEDGETVDVLYSHDHNGNNYIEIPIEFIFNPISKAHWLKRKFEEAMKGER